MKESVREALHQRLTECLEANSYRKTPERYAILDAVFAMGKCFTIDELGAKLAADGTFQVSRATLYNTMRLFVSLRLVIRHRFQGTTRYEACHNSGSHCHRVCTICGGIMEIKSAEVAEAVGRLHLRRFRKEGYSLYVYGVCSACQAKLTRKKSSEQKKQKSQKNNNSNEQR